MSLYITNVILLLGRLSGVKAHCCMYRKYVLFILKAIISTKSVRERSDAVRDVRN